MAAMEYGLVQINKRCAVGYRVETLFLFWPGAIDMSAVKERFSQGQSR
ncbi:MAG: hypothetical protein LBU43_02330 [Candidatus Accumulibacter sp.]|jgi:hypothetical protein|nr:hypothetical protein [Accumulibacter sp.]